MKNWKGEFIREFCNNHNLKIRFLRGIFFDDADEIEQINNFFYKLRLQDRDELIKMLPKKEEINVGDYLISEDGDYTLYDVKLAKNNTIDKFKEIINNIYNN